MTRSLLDKIRQRAADPSAATDHSAQFPTRVPPPVDESSMRRAEALIGRALPTPLRDAYCLIGNGGFGPGYGLLPLLTERDSPDADSVVRLHTVFRGSDPEDPVWAWPADLVPFCDWGCAIRSCVDCSSPMAPVLTFDPGARDVGDPTEAALATTHASLEAWFQDWLAGRSIWELMFEPDASRAVTLVNPFTRKPFQSVPNKLRRL